MIFLETERLILRNIRPEDADTVFDYRNNEICARYQRGQTKDLPGIRALTDRRMNDTLTVTDNAMVAVALKETDEMVGEIVVMPNDDCFSVGYTFHYAHHRRGYAFEALSCLIEYLHSLQPDWEFISFTERENIPSQKLLKKLGYTDMGYVEKLDSQMFGKYLAE